MAPRLDISGDLRRATVALQQAKHTYTRTASEAARQRYMLTIEQDIALREGVEGKNQAERDAALQLVTADRVHSLHMAEQALLDARCEVECAQAEFDCLRYEVRLLEVAL